MTIVRSGEKSGEANARADTASDLARSRLGANTGTASTSPEPLAGANITRPDAIRHIGTTMTVPLASFQLSPAAPLLKMSSGTCSMMGCGMSLGSDAARTSAALPRCPSLPTTPAGGAPTPSDDDSAWGCARGAEARWPLMGGCGTLGAGAACLSEDTPRCSLTPLPPAGGASPPSDDDSER
eukprot:5632534-Prymnesium_polylepis.1